jgi:hypothetical protein
MERRRKPVARNRSRSVSHKAVAKNSAVVPLSNIADLISDGEITVGVLRPVGCVATATDGHNCLAMLVRRRGETLAQLLISSRSSHRQSAHRRHLYRRNQSPVEPFLNSSL